MAGKNESLKDGTPTPVAADTPHHIHILRWELVMIPFKIHDSTQDTKHAGKCSTAMRTGGKRNGV